MLWVATVVVFAWTLYATTQHSLSYGFRLPPASATAVTTQSTSHFDTYFASSKLHTQVHAASLVELKNNRVRAFWFSGSREGAADVTIHSAVFDVAQQMWSDEQEVTGRESTQRGLHRYISKVGNPVVVRAADGNLWMFYVTVSLGGWAGSSITLMTSSDEGASWSAPRRLITSPFINISTLVKAPPFFYADGTMGLPVYHEFISKFAEVLRLDATGKVIDKQRMVAGGNGTLQPVVLVRDEKNALALTRYAGADKSPRVVSLSTADGGEHWSAPSKSALKNSNAALTALVLADGRMLAVLNDQEQGRETLSLSMSIDGGTTWRELLKLEDMGAPDIKGLDEAACMKRVEELVRTSDKKLQQADVQHVADYVASAQARVRSEGNCGFEFSYPYLIQTRNGDVHVAYTWNRVFIKHAVFDAAWLAKAGRP